MNADKQTSSHLVLIYVILLALMWAGTSVLRVGPDPDTLDFDTDTAFQIARELIPENKPHPSGSRENRLVADRIESRLNDMGYAVERQGELFCTDFAPGCTRLENLLAVRKGRNPGNDAILVTAHYDSVPGAPGAADDIAGVAALLHIAHLIADSPPARNDIIFLFADAEETGLRGAQAFARSHPLMQKVKFVINLEARGVEGPSQMFETSTGNAEIIGLLVATANRPVASSLMYEAYRRMPNNTDMTIYKNAGAIGINFAFSRGVALYHSSLDDIDHLSPASLGHHGDNVLHYLVCIADMDLAELESPNDASYIDLFGKYLLAWPAWLNLPAAIASLILILGVALNLRVLQIRSVAVTLGLFSLLLASHLMLGWLLSWPLARWPGIHGLDHPYPGAGNLALFATGVLLTLMFASFAGKRLGNRAFLFSSWLIYAVLACLLAWAVAGAAYLLLLPVVVFALMAALERLLRQKSFPAFAAWAGLVVAAYMGVYHFIFMDVLTSFYAAWMKMLPLALVAVVAVPVIATQGIRRWPMGLLAGILVAATVTAALVPAYTPDRPRSVNIAYQQVRYNDSTVSPDAADRAHWRMFTFGPPDTEYARAAGFPAQQQSFLRWGYREAEAYLLDIPDLQLPTPEFQLVRDEREGSTRILSGTVQAGRSGFLLGMSLAPGTQVIGLDVEGVPVLTDDNYAPEKGAAVRFTGVGDQALEVSLRVPAEQTFELVLFELSAFPDNAEGKAIIALRPADAASIHFSDHTEVQHVYQF
ncbi:MAG: M20/M25/M40 family metallo-hydrolase [Xanthomonadales bacterium]|jgi:hypothetical protein|nr:M20/M25/M40 family metallo-hydrolase [Xanthomonadales bacterium]